MLAHYFRVVNRFVYIWLFQDIPNNLLVSVAACACGQCVVVFVVSVLLFLWSVCCCSFRPVPKSNKRPSKSHVAKTNGTLEDLKRQLGGKKKSSMVWDLLPYNNSYTNLLDDYALNTNMTQMNENETDDDADEHPPYEVAIVYGKTEVILSNLRHFQEYSIEVGIQFTSRSTALR